MDRPFADKLPFGPFLDVSSLPTSDDGTFTMFNSIIDTGIDGRFGV